LVRQRIAEIAEADAIGDPSWLRDGLTHRDGVAIVPYHLQRADPRRQEIAVEVCVERFGWTFCPGDKVMQVENDYDKDVYNGDLGVVSRVDVEEGELSVAFDGREMVYGFGELDQLVLAYATTIHKSQGSEYPAVVIPLSTQHYPMLQRNLVYTGVTRGRRLVVLVGHRKALAIAVKGARVRRR
jgi:exodeoxyribonuclease V alpha subunit